MLQHFEGRHNIEMTVGVGEICSSGEFGFNSWKAAFFYGVDEFYSVIEDVDTVCGDIGYVGEHGPEEDAATGSHIKESLGNKAFEETNALCDSG